jgi:L-alanine-DL-glutamate epimerase-like enolase superfamily enzyme
VSGDVIAAEAIRVRVPFRRPVVTSVGRWSHRESWIVRLFDAAGAVGLGEAALDLDAGEGAAAELAQLVRETVDLVCGGHGLPSAAELEPVWPAGRCGAAWTRRFLTCGSRRWRLPAAPLAPFRSMPRSVSSR